MELFKSWLCHNLYKNIKWGKDDVLIWCGVYWKHSLTLLIINSEQKYSVFMKKYLSVPKIIRAILILLFLGSIFKKPFGQSLWMGTSFLDNFTEGKGVHFSVLWLSDTGKNTGEKIWWPNYSRLLKCVQSTGLLN